MRSLAEKTWGQVYLKHGCHRSTFHGTLIMLVPWASKEFFLLGGPKGRPQGGDSLA